MSLYHDIDKRSNISVDSVVAIAVNIPFILYINYDVPHMRKKLYFRQFSAFSCSYPEIIQGRKKRKQLTYVYAHECTLTRDTKGILMSELTHNI